MKRGEGEREGKEERERGEGAVSKPSHVALSL
jgi:hypothetical protein